MRKRPERERDPEVLRLYAARRRRQIILIVPLLGLFALMVASEGQEDLLGVPQPFVLGAAFALILAAIVFSFLNWRCPACSSYLGKHLNPRYCWRCGEPLR